MTRPRLTEEQLDSLEHSHGMIESEYTPTCRSARYGNGCPGATDDTQDFWRRAADCVPAMVAELRVRRAADLTDAQRNGLRAVLAFLTDNAPSSTEDKQAGIDALVKLLSGGG